jgi:hypothetical protein
MKRQPTIDQWQQDLSDVLDRANAGSEYEALFRFAVKSDLMQWRLVKGTPDWPTVSIFDQSFYHGYNYEIAKRFGVRAPSYSGRLTIHRDTYKLGQQAGKLSRNLPPDNEFVSIQKLWNSTPNSPEEILFIEQQGRCAICRHQHDPEWKNATLVIDHDHVTNLIRGLLCSDCNTREHKKHTARWEHYLQNPPAGNRRWPYKGKRRVDVAPK